MFICMYSCPIELHNKKKIQKFLYKIHTIQEKGPYIVSLSLDLCVLF